MSFSGKLSTTLLPSEDSKGQTMLTTIDCSFNGQSFYSGSLASVWPDTDNELPDNIFLTRIKSVAAGLNLTIESYDDLCLAQAMVANGIDDLNQLGKMYASQNGLPLSKTEAFLKLTKKQEQSEKQEIKKSRRK